MYKKTFYGLGSMVLGLSLCGYSIQPAQGQVIQLKEAVPLTETSEAGTEQEQKTDQSTDADPLQNLAPVPQADGEGSVQSYSIVTENRMGPDGKRIQKKKVWKNGVLVENKEETIEGDADESLSAEMDGQVIPGTVFRSERNGNNFFMIPNGVQLDAESSELLKKMEDEFNARRAQIMNQFGGVVSGTAIPFGDSGGTTEPLPPQKLSEYWIGASVSSVPVEVAYQVDLAEGEGLFVKEILPESPAEKAGLAKYDILLKIGDKTIHDISEIGELIDQSEGAPVTIEYIRKGEKNTLELTPEKRPEDSANMTLPFSMNQAANETAAGNEKVMVVRPGMIVPNTEEPQGTDANSAEQTVTTDAPAESAPAVSVPEADSGK